MRERPGPGPVGGPSTPPIDPRIRARRVEVQRQDGRRRLRRLADVGLVAAVLLGFAGALRSPLLDVDEVRVDGARRSGADTVRAAAGIELGDQLVDLDLGSAGRAVAALPWVDRVAIDRGLDGTVTLTVEERRPVARVGEGAAALLVDATGRVLGPADPSDVEGLVALTGLTGAVAPGDLLPVEAGPALAVAERLDPDLAAQLTSLAVGDEVVASLRSGGVAELGPPTRVAAKLRSLSTVLARVDLSCLATIDVRAPGSPVLTRGSGCS